MWPNKEVSDPSGYTPLECFVYFDTHGKHLPCNDILKLRLIQHGKQMFKLNLQLWCDGVMEDMYNHLEQIKEIKKHCDDEKYPDWVFTDFIGQLKKRYIKRDGFVPSFVTNFMSPNLPTFFS